MKRYATPRLAHREANLLPRLPNTARLAGSQSKVFEQFSRIVDLDDAIVVEIGGCLPRGLVEQRAVGRWFSCDPSIPARSDGPVESLGCPAEEIPIEDASVDFVFSCNAMQHVSNPMKVFREAARVLRPGGAFYANFGPVWSAPDGAHIEALFFEGMRYDFWNQCLLPAWAHLVVDEEEELANALSHSHSDALAAHIAAYVFRSTWINRTPADEFRNLAISEFDPVFFEGNAEFDYPFCPPDPAPEIRSRLKPSAITSEVRKRHPGIQADQFSRDIEFFLIRDENCARS